MKEPGSFIRSNFGRGMTLSEIAQTTGWSEDKVMTYARMNDLTPWLRPASPEPPSEPVPHLEGFQIARDIRKATIEDAYWRPESDE